MNLELSCGRRPITKSSWEIPRTQPVLGTAVPGSGTQRPPQALRNCGFRESSGVGAVLVCPVPGNRDHPTVAATTERILPPNSGALF